MLAERNDLFADDDVLFVGRGEEGEAIGLLLAGLVADEDDDLADAVNLGLLDGLHLPHGVVVEAQVGLHEGVDDFLGGRGGGEVWPDRAREIQGRPAGAAEVRRLRGRRVQRAAWSLRKGDDWMGRENRGP